MFHAPLRFDLGPDIEALRDMVHAWAQDRLKPQAAAIDRTNAFPPALWREMGDLGLLGITVEEDSAAPAWDTSPMSSRSRRSPAPRPRSACPMGRIPTSA
jgi:alkylation response protein AidB-like acyl-CoA dehydrogenase